MGLRAKATAIPVEKVSVGAATAPAAIDIQGVWLVSVKTIPENPTDSTAAARRALSAHVVGPTIRSSSTVGASLVRGAGRLWRILAPSGSRSVEDGTRIAEGA